MFLPIILLAIFIIAFRLDDIAVYHYDEAVSMLAVQNMLESKDVLFPTVDGSKLWGKPPLKTFLTSGVVYFFGHEVFNYRILDGLFALGTVLLILLCTNLKRETRAIAAVLFLCSPVIFGEHVALMSVQDSALTFFVTLAFLYPRCAVVGFICATLVKGAAALPFLLAFVPFAKGSKIKFLVLSLLPITLYYLYHFDSLSYVLGHEVVKRSTEGFHNSGKPLYYLRTFFDPSYYLINFLYVLGILWGLCSFKSNKGLLCWALLPLILFSIPSSRLEWYLAPSIPALSILAAGIFSFTGGLVAAAAPLSFLLYQNFEHIKSFPEKTEVRAISTDLLYSQPPLKIYSDPNLRLPETEKALYGRIQKSRFVEKEEAGAALLSVAALRELEGPLRQVKFFEGTAVREPYAVVVWEERAILHNFRPTINLRALDSQKSFFVSGWNGAFVQDRALVTSLENKVGILKFDLDYISTLTNAELRVWVKGDSVLSFNFNGRALGREVVKSNDWKVVAFKISKDLIAAGENFLAVELLEGEEALFLRAEWRELHG